MSAQHTPGPWFAHQHHRRSFARAITTSPGNARGDIANVISGLGSKNVEADAHLIAAAPDLLASAQAVIAWWSEWAAHGPQDDAIEAAEWREFRALRAAIAKATQAEPQSPGGAG